MKTFVLEDNDQRITFFKRLFPLADYAKTVTEAKELLTKNKYDQLFLDHDLGDQVYVDSDEPETGYQVAKFIMYESNHNRTASVIIHSLNWAGAQNIKSIIPWAKIIPFTNLTKTFTF